MTLGALLMRGSGPAGTRTGSVPALKAKLQPAEEFAGMQSDKRSREKAAAAAEIDAIKNSVSFDPEALGLLPVPAPHVAQPRGDQTRLDLMNGSWTVRQIGEAAEAKRAEKAAEEARKQDARAAREQKKEDEAASLQALVAAYTLCRPICGCGKSPCPMAKATRCPTCSKISEKGRPCIKQVCVQARRAADAAAAGAPATAAPLPGHPLVVPAVSIAHGVPGQSTDTVSDVLGDRQVCCRHPFALCPKTEAGARTRVR